MIDTGILLIAYRGRVKQDLKSKLHEVTDIEARICTFGTDNVGNYLVFVKAESSAKMSSDFDKKSNFEILSSA